MRSLEEFLAKKAKAKERKAKRKAKAAILWVGEQTSRTDIKVKIVRALGLLDRKLHGGACRIHGAPCVGTLAYHILPQMLGDAFRFIRLNVVWACAKANRGEQMNRSLYAEKHLAIFGAARIQAIRDEAARIKASPEFPYSRAALLGIFENVRIKLALDNDKDIS